MNWIKLEEEITTLATKIDFEPDIIVALVRGGIIPARLLSTQLKTQTMYCLSVRKNGLEREVVTLIKDSVEGKLVLLVEDVLETGKSLEVAKNYLDLQGATVKTAALYVLSSSTLKPDYYLGVCEEVPLFPWE